MSPRSRWKFNNFQTNIITAIPEASSEDDLPAAGQEEYEQEKEEKIYSPARATIPPKPLATTPKPFDRNVIEEQIALRNNIFLQIEENNFMKGERPTPSFSVQRIAKKNDVSATIANDSEPLSQSGDETKLPSLETSF